MSMDCELAQTLLKKLEYLETRVTYLEGKSRGQQVVIEKLQKKLKKLKMKTRNKDKLSQKKLVAAAEPKVELIEKIEITHNEPLNIMKKDPKISQKLVIRMGVRCDEESQGNVNPVEKTVKDTSKMTQIKTENSQKDGKIREISSKPKEPVKKSQVCSFCSKSFRNFFDLSQHMRVHTGERPFKCKICSKSFSRMETLNRHNLVHTGEKPFSCSVCSKSFSHASTLQNHMRIHTGEKPFSCSVCSRTFANDSALKRHIRVHTGEKPYSCSFCRKSFAQIEHRNAHIRTHLGEKPYSCSVCSKTFVQSSTLRHHKTKIHTDKAI